jgi:hypothetical protein
MPGAMYQHHAGPVAMPTTAWKREQLMTTLAPVIPLPKQDTPGTTPADAARILLSKCPGLTGAGLRARLREAFRDGLSDVADAIDTLASS